ncbi:MAG: hypothetical protein H6Q01_889 [Acidobacteria bacterium]|nr:hypothetical protein [Acidobacteriota bacterium]
MRPSLVLLAAVIVVALAASAAPGLAGTPTMVAWAPGFPGSTKEAQPTMDALAGAVAAAAKLPPDGFAAVYQETEKGGLARLSQPDAALAMVSLPAFLKYEKELGLVPRLAVVQAGAPDASETWSLVAGAGKLKGAADLAGWQLVSGASYAPRFVRGPALGGWGVLPANVTLAPAGAVLSALRRAAAGEQVALLLDRAQAASLATLPFAKDLETVARSAPLPGALLCTVRGRLPDAQAAALVQAFAGLAARPEAAAALAGVRIARFVPLDEAALKRARAAYDAVKDAP